MKILFFTTRYPSPPFKGDQLIAYNQIKYLKKTNPNIQIYLISLIDEEIERDSELEEFCSNVLILKYSKLHFYLGLLLAPFRGLPFQVSAYTSNNTRNKIKSCIKNIDPDCIYVNFIRGAEYFKGVETRKVLNMIDALSLNMSRRAKNESNLFKKILFNYEAKLLKKYEVFLLNEFNATILVSESDKSVFKDNKNKIFVNPNGTEFLNYGTYNIEKSDKYIIFHGNMSYFPNVDAVIWFIEAVWKISYQRLQGYKFLIVGKDPIGEVTKYNNLYNIEVTGFVNDMPTILKKSRMAIYPLRSGTGMQNKVLESLACGVPTIASDFALQGFTNYKHGEELLVANSVNEMQKSIVRLIQDKELCLKLSQKGREYIANNYSWEANCCSLSKLLAP